MKKVLIVNPYYFPGYRSGGPQQTIANIVDAFGDRADIYILTQDHDYGVCEPYKNIKYDEWITVGKAKVKYLREREFSYRGFKNAYKEFGIIYSCGLFEKNSILMMIIHHIRKKDGDRLYIAPMGVFSPGAIHIKYMKKKCFLALAKILGLFDGIIWSFTSEEERKQASDVLKYDIDNYIIAEDLPKNVDFSKFISNLEQYSKEPRKLKIIFLSRICEKKNLLYCANILRREYVGEILFDIYGTIESKAYWNMCKDRFKTLPKNIRVQYCGEVNAEQVISIFSQYDIFLFPTKGENYGHVIYEALAAGCIPVISNTTPWHSFNELNCGNIVDLENIKEFQEKVDFWLKCDKNQLLLFKQNAIEYAAKKYIDSITNSGYKKILQL